MKRPRLIFRALHLVGTAAVFALANWFSALFSFPSGASFLFPPAGVSLAAGAAFGLWGVAGVVLGVLLAPWGRPLRPLQFHRAFTGPIPPSLQARGCLP